MGRASGLLYVKGGVVNFDHMRQILEFKKLKNAISKKKIVLKI